MIGDYTHKRSIQAGKNMKILSPFSISHSLRNSKTVDYTLSLHVDAAGKANISGQQIKKAGHHRLLLHPAGNHR